METQKIDAPYSYLYMARRHIRLAFEELKELGRIATTPELQQLATSGMLSINAIHETIEQLYERHTGQRMLVGDPDQPDVDEGIKGDGDPEILMEDVAYSPDRDPGDETKDEGSYA